MKHGRLIQYGVIAALLGLAIATRFLPHPPNLTAVAAAGFFAAAVFPRRWGVFIPLAAMAVSDVFIGFHELIAFTWGSMAIHAALGLFARRHPTPFRVVGLTLAGSFQFFFITNWAVWQFGTMYPHSAAGLLESYVAAIPFLRNSTLGDLFYTGVLFGLYEAARAFTFRLAALRVRQ